MNQVPIVIEPEAKSDIAAARDYYSLKGEHLSDRFRDELTRALEQLSHHPESVAVAFGCTLLDLCAISHTSSVTSTLMELFM